MKLEISQEVFEKYTNIKFQENPTSEKRVLPCGQMDKRTAMTRLVFAFRSFANTRNKRRKRN